MAELFLYPNGTIFYRSGMPIKTRRHYALLACFAVMTSSCGMAAERMPPPPAPPPPYADVADFAVKAPLVIDGTIRDAAKLKGPDATGVPAGYQRYYLTLDVIALIRGAQAVPQRLGYVYDAPLGASGKPPRLKQLRVILFARPAATADDHIQLVAPDAQIAWSPAADQLTRAVAAAVADRNAPPRIVGITNAFHAAGTLPGDGETQIFLATSGRPVSLGITRRQGQPPAWTVALTEVVDDALPPPRRDTFLWYRLACGLPAGIDDAKLEGVDAADATAIRGDYALVKRDLGPCRADSPR